MEEEKQTQPKGQWKQEKFQKEIEQLGLGKQNQTLLEKGFKNQKKNLKLLQQFNGDIQKVTELLEIKQKQKESRTFKKLASFGLIEKNQQLIDLGYTDAKKNLRCLKLANFEVDGAVTRLSQKKKQSSESIPDLHLKNKELISKGFNNYKKNQNVLKKVGGNMTEAISILQQKTQKRELRVKVKELSGQEQLTKEAQEIEFAGKTLYLDGNNILFNDETIRSTYLKKSRQVGERMLEAIAIKFVQMHKMSRLVLIFDGKGKKVKQSIEGVEVERTFAEAENFKISDDYLAKEANDLPQEKREKSVFVTSDRELINRILISGCQFVMRSSTWMKAVKELISKEEFEKILQSVQ